MCAYIDEHVKSFVYLFISGSQLGVLFFIRFFKRNETQAKWEYFFKLTIYRKIHTTRLMVQRATSRFLKKMVQRATSRFQKKIWGTFL